MFAQLFKKILPFYYYHVHRTPIISALQPDYFSPHWYPFLYDPFCVISLYILLAFLTFPMHNAFTHPHHDEAFNPLKPNDTCSGCTAPLTSKRCILYIYSTNMGTEYFKHGIFSLSVSLQNAVCFIILTYLVPVLFTFYIQGVLKLKK